MKLETEGQVIPGHGFRVRIRLREAGTSARALMAFSGLFLGLCAGLVSWLRTSGAPPRPLIHQVLEFPASAPWKDQFGPTLDLAPDGSTLVYHSQTSSTTGFSLISLDELEPVSVPNTAGALYPSFSPDGQWIGYQQSGQLLKVPSSGGRPEPLCDQSVGPLTTYGWLDNRTIVLADRSGLTSCSIDTGSTALYRLQDSTEHLAWPHILPDGTGILYTLSHGDNLELGVYNRQTGVTRALGLEGSNPRYVAGYLVYATRDGILRAVRFILANHQTSGDPFIVARGIRVGKGGGAKVAAGSRGLLITPSPAGGQ